MSLRTDPVTKSLSMLRTFRKFPTIGSMNQGNVLTCSHTVWHFRLHSAKAFPVSLANYGVSYVNLLLVSHVDISVKHKLTQIIIPDNFVDLFV